jgi:hypothetical protein
MDTPTTPIPTTPTTPILTPARIFKTREEAMYFLKKEPHKFPVNLVVQIENENYKIVLDNNKIYKIFQALEK